MSKLNDILGINAEDAEKIRKQLVSYLFPARIISLTEIREAFGKIRNDFHNIRLEHYFSRLMKGNEGCPGRLILPNNKDLTFSYHKGSSYRGNDQMYWVYIV